MQKKPHIIIFNPDEMRADSMAHLGNPAAITPNFDEFAKNDAVSFSRTFCQNPVCVPSRCSFMTGLYPHVHGHRTMAYLLRPGEDSLLKELKDGGYYVWMNDRNDLTAGEIEGWTESQADEIYYTDGKKRAPGPKENLRGERGSKNYYSHYNGELKTDENGVNYSADDQAVDAAIERLLNPVDDRPVCAFIGLLYPHVPYNVEEPYFSAIDRSKLKKRVDHADCKDKAPIMNAIRNNLSMESYSEKDWDELRATYLGMCMKVDYQFGRLVNALKKAGIYEDSAIFVLSDHGDFTGDYSLVEKAQNTFEDCLTNVPLLIKPPKGYDVDAGVSDALTELVDFYATVVDIAGIKSSHTHYGRSLVKNVADRSLRNRDFVCSEGGREAGEVHCDEFHAAGANGPDQSVVYWPRISAEKDDVLHDKGIMIRTERYKYVSRSKGKDEFYDLEKDPSEKINVIDDESYADEVVKLKGELLKWLQQTADVVPFNYDARFTEKMLWAKVSAMVPPEEKDKVLGFIKEGISFSQLMNYCVGLKKGKR